MNLSKPHALFYQSTDTNWVPTKLPDTALGWEDTGVNKRRNSEKEMASLGLRKSVSCCSNPQELVLHEGDSLVYNEKF